MALEGTTAAEFTVAIGEYVLRCVPGGLPTMFDTYAKHAVLVERIDLTDQHPCCVLVSRVGQPWPFLIVAQSYSPAGVGFAPGVLLAPDTARLFVGAGERLLAYDLVDTRRLWIDRADAGFWGWARHGDVIVMSAELELAAWTAEGEKLWTTFVEPPWDYTVDGDGFVVLDVMGATSRFPLRLGPPPRA